MLAIDFGERRWGLAISDPTGTIALPLEVVESAGWAADLARLRGLIERYEVDEVVVGRPLGTRGTVGPQAQRAARFAARLRRAIGIPVVEVDERFSTVAAGRALRATGGSPRERRGRLDAVAAALILQPHLDRRKTTAALQE